jgi:hypothetical protein
VTLETDNAPPPQTPPPPADPERHEHAEEIVHTSRGLLPFFESPITWGGIGILLGTIAAVAPLPSLRYAFILAWIIFAFAFVRHNVFQNFNVLFQVVANTLLILITGAILLWIFRLIPPPKDLPTAKEIAAEQHFPTATEIAQAVTQIAPSQGQHTKTALPLVKIVFKQTPLFTSARRRNITAVIGDCYVKLSNLGFPLEKELPPFGVSASNVQSMSGVFPGTIYQRQISFPKSSLDNPDSLRRVYLSYVFRTLFRTFGPDADLPPDFELRTNAAALFTSYYASSISGKNLDSNEWKGHNWMMALWEIHQKQGKSLTDEYMYYIFRTWDNGSIAPAGEFQDVFLTRFLAGVWVKDNLGTSLRAIEPILRKYNLTKGG